MSNFTKELNKEFKNKRVSLLSEDKKNELKKGALSTILSDINNKKNRFVFYCPDIPLVNPLIKLVYEVALEVHKAGFSVVMLHEINGYKAHWLFKSKGYEEYKDLAVEYVMTKQAGKKTKKTSTSYSFNVSDTLIVTDAYQDILENILSEESLKLVQKIVLVTGYMGLASMNPGMDYNRLNVNSLVFFDDNIKQDYADLFVTKNYIIDNYPVSTGFNRTDRKANEVAPVIAISCIGNNDKAQQLINVFYNKYPNLSMFTFSVLGREDMDTYIAGIKTAAAVVIIDKNVVTKQMVYETLSVGTPVLLPKRREYMDNKIVIENYIVEDDIFEMAAQIAEYCNYWLNNPTTAIMDSVWSTADSLALNERTVENFSQTVLGIFGELQENRHTTFNKLITSIPHE